MGFLLLESISLVLFSIMVLAFNLLVGRIKTEKGYNILFVISSLLTVFLHYLGCIVYLFMGKSYDFSPNMYIPVYPCNAIMILNVVMIFFVFKRGKVFDCMADISFFIGTTCGIIGLMFNENFLNTIDSGEVDIDIIKGLLSHGAMIFTCVSLLVFGKLKISMVRNVIHSLIGCAYFVLCFLVSNLILSLANRPKVDYYLITESFNGIKIINFYTISLVGLILLITFTYFYERKTLEKENRSYVKLLRKVKK